MTVPEPRSGAAPNTMPETDWLTGLASRAAFARQVNQADRDRDRFAIAVIGIGDFGEVNRRLGYDAGDDLLREIGRALADRTSVNTVAARLGGARFGVLDLQTADRDTPRDQLHRWLSPIASALRAAITTWAFDQHDHAGGDLIEPELLVGAAAGYTKQVWIDATVALELAELAEDGRTVVEYDHEDQRVLELRRRSRIVEASASALADNSLGILARTVRPCPSATEAGSRWLRLELGLADPEAGSPGAGGPGADGQEADDRTDELDLEDLPPDLAAQLDWWLINAAAVILSGTREPLRLTVPLSTNVDAGREFARRLAGLLRRHQVAPSRLLFEVTESAMNAAGPAWHDLGPQLRQLGSGIVLAGCDGGWRTAAAARALPVWYLKPSHELLSNAEAGDRSAKRIIDTLAEDAAEHDWELIVPYEAAASSPVLPGFCHVEAGTLHRVGESALTEQSPAQDR